LKYSKLCEKHTSTSRTENGRTDDMQSHNRALRIASRDKKRDG